MEREANWPGPEGLIPALPKDASNASWHTRRFLDEILIEERIIGTHVADISMQLWGKRFASPIMMPAFSHLNKAGLDHSPMEEYAQAAMLRQSASSSLLQTVKRSGRRWTLP